MRLPLEQVKIEGAVSVMTQPKLQWAMHTSVSAYGSASGSWWKIEEPVESGDQGLRA